MVATHGISCVHGPVPVASCRATHGLGVTIEHWPLFGAHTSPVAWCGLQTLLWLWLNHNHSNFPAVSITLPLGSSYFGGTTSDCTACTDCMYRCIIPVMCWHPRSCSLHRGGLLFL